MTSKILPFTHAMDTTSTSLDVKMQTHGGVHVREIKHDSLELMTVLVDGGALGEASEVIIGVGGDVDGDKLLPKGGHEVMPGRGVCVHPMPHEVMRVGPVPEGSVLLEEGGSEGDSAAVRDGEELAVLLHLEDPGF